MNKVWVVEVRNNCGKNNEHMEVCLVHIASSQEKAIEWARTQGPEFDDEHFWWAIYDETVDHEESWVGGDDLIFLTKHGVIVEEQPIDPA